MSGLPYLLVTATWFFAPGYPTPKIVDYYRDFATMDECKSKEKAFNEEMARINSPSMAKCFDKKMFKALDKQSMQ